MRSDAAAGSQSNRRVLSVNAESERYEGQHDIHRWVFRQWRNVDVRFCGRVGQRSADRQSDDHDPRAKWIGIDEVSAHAAVNCYFFGCASRKSNTFRMFSGVRMNGTM